MSELPAIAAAAAGFLVLVLCGLGARRHNRRGGYQLRDDGARDEPIPPTGGSGISPAFRPTCSGCGERRRERGRFCHRRGHGFAITYSVSVHRRPAPSPAPPPAPR